MKKTKPENQNSEKSQKRTKSIRIIVISSITVVLIGAIIFGVIYLGTKFGWGILSNHRKTLYSNNALAENYLKNDWKGKWIWCDDDDNSQWVVFRKDFYCDEPSDSSYLDIATDTHYWLWINGELIVFEGNSKRGATPNDGFYDHVETDAFIKGKNNITILVNYLNDSGYSHKDSGHGGLLVDGLAGATGIYSDESFLAEQYRAYQYHWYDFIYNLNFRLSERASNIYGEYVEEFWRLDMDCSDWKNAVVLDEATASAFGATYLNILPQKSFSEIIPYTNSSDYVDKTFTKAQTVCFKLPYNLQFTPYFELSSEKETTIKYYVDNADKSKTYSLKSNYKNRYHTACGNQSFEDYSWQNGEYLIVEFPKGITLLNAGYRQSAYGCKTVEDNFSSNDDFLNTLYKKAVNTLTVTMRDNYMDCPDRERAQWIGDAAIESEMAYYALSPNASLLFKKAILTLYGWQHEDGVFQTVAPDGVDAYELPQQNLAAIVAFEKYLLYTGDYTVFDEIYKLTFDYLKVFDMKNGLIEHRAGSWDWGDWGKAVDIKVLDNAWYYYALCCAKSMSEYAEDAENLAFCNERIESIINNFDKEFWHDDGYRSGKKTDDRANAIAVLSGLADKSKYETITKVLTSVYSSSPYMEKYVEEALCIMGKTDLAIERAKVRYSEMTEYEGSTLWELWDREKGTANHAWSGGTLVILTKYLSGISPTSQGYSAYEISPELSILDNFSCTINPKEDKFISIALTQRQESCNLEVYSDFENGTLVLNDVSKVYVNGIMQSFENNVCRIEIPCGKTLNVSIE